MWDFRDIWDFRDESTADCSDGADEISANEMLKLRAFLNGPVEIIEMAEGFGLKH